jgi:hypothetical protein
MIKPGDMARADVLRRGIFSWHNGDHSHNVHCLGEVMFDTCVLVIATVENYDEMWLYVITMGKCPIIGWVRNSGFTGV